MPTQSKPKKVGRPKLPKGEAKGKLVALRFKAEDLKRNAIDAVRVYKGKKSVDCLSFRVNQSKSILDEIDRVLAQHYGFTAEELDFILNYDIKYRLGRDIESDAE